MVPNVIDLKIVVEGQGDHYSATHRDEIVATCPTCQEFVSQSMNECSACQEPVIWKNSPAWKLLYGSPNDAIRRLTYYSPDEDDSEGMYLMLMADRAGFRTQTDLKLWNRGRRVLGDKHLHNLVRYACEHAKIRGRMPLALNIVRKNLAERPVQKKKSVVPGGGPTLEEQTEYGI